MRFGNKEEYVSGREIKVSVNNLTKCYDDLLVLNDINFDIYKGEMLCIVGPTGCGKTTFLNCLSRFIPITEGSILGGRQRPPIPESTTSPLSFRRFRPFPG